MRSAGVWRGSHTTTSRRTGVAAELYSGRRLAASLSRHQRELLLFAPSGVVYLERLRRAAYA